MLVAGLLVRLFAMVFYDTAVFDFYGGDSVHYLRLAGGGGLFSRALEPAGYPAFLHAVRWVWAWLPFTIGIQHLLGLVGAVLLFATVRRFGAPAWLAVVPAAVAALGGDQIFLEHAVLTEAIWPFTIALGLFALARAYTARSMRGLMAAGALLALPALVRSTGLVVPVVAVVWVVAAFGGPWRTRLRAAAALGLVAGAVIGGYVGLARSTGGGHDGLLERGGFSLYMRVAPFADCRRFHPPAGTAGLCESSPPGARPGPGHYGFNPESPLRREYGMRVPSSLLGDFARRVILHQPLDYLRAVARDEARLVAPDAGRRRLEEGARPEDMSFARSEPFGQGPPGAQAPREAIAAAYASIYTGVGAPRAPGAGFEALGVYQDAFRLDGLLLIAAVALTVAGLARGRGPARAGAALFAALALLLDAIPPAVLQANLRFASTPQALAAAAAALAAAALLERGRGSGEPTGDR